MTTTTKKRSSSTNKKSKKSTLDSSGLSSIIAAPTPYFSPSSMSNLCSCAGCDGPILDQYVYNVLDRAWHQTCIQCSDCKLSLMDRCFSREGKLFCRDDFMRRFGPRCSGCSGSIAPTDLVRRAKDKVFHLNCFTCCVCRKAITTGEQLYVVDENKFMCKQDYLQNKSQDDLDDLDHPNLKSPHNTTLGSSSYDSSSSSSSSASSIGCGDLSTHTSHMSNLKSNFNSPTPATPRRLTNLNPHNHHSQIVNGILENKNLNNQHDSLLSPSQSKEAYDQLQANSQDTTMLIPGSSNNQSILSLPIDAEKENLINTTNNSESSNELMFSNHPENKDLPSSYGQQQPQQQSHLMFDNDFLDSDKDDNSDEDLDDEDDDDEDEEDENGNKHSSSSSSKDDGNLNGKKRGPRTTIKAKQLEMLKSAFSATPKPTRHIREQLAAETGLNMRVIQVWFQNRRSKERRMKQLNAMGNRRHYYRNAAAAASRMQQQQTQQVPDVTATSRLAPPQQQLIGSQLGHNQIQHNTAGSIGQFNSEQPDNMMNNILSNNNSNSTGMGSMGGFMPQDFYSQMSYTEVAMIQQQNDMQSQRFHPSLNTEVQYRLSQDIADNISPNNTSIEQHYSSPSMIGLNGCLGQATNELKEVGW